MINLYKVNGQLKARGKLLADYTEVIVANAKEQWLKDMEAEYDGLFPTWRKMTEDEKPLEYEKWKIESNSTRTFEEWQTFTPCIMPLYYEHTFDSWLLEKEFVEPIVTEDDLDTYLKSRYKELRATEYPKVEDYMDAIVKGDIDAQNEYIAKCLAIKIKYPK